jgi:hypothetical protein
MKNLLPPQTFINSDSSDLIEDVIKKYQSMGLSENQFCAMLDIKRFSWTQFSSGNQQKFDFLLFIKLAQFLGVKIETIADKYLENTVEKDKLNVAKRNIYIANHFDLKTLRKIGFFDASPLDFSALEVRIKEFFGFDSIYEIGRAHV